MQNLLKLKMAQKIARIEQIAAPIQRPDEYKKIFGNCCSTPQTQVIS
jgi:hypothetical protein